MLLALATVAILAQDPSVTALESLVNRQEQSDPLEHVMKMTQNELLEVKIHQVLKKHKVLRPQYYAKLIAHREISVKEKYLATAILIPESGGDSKARSNKGAQGAWQVMPMWKRMLNIKGSLYDPPTCLDAAIKVYNIHLKESNGSVKHALIAYSGNAVGYAKKVMSIMRELG